MKGKLTKEEGGGGETEDEEDGEVNRKINKDQEENRKKTRMRNHLCKLLLGCSSSLRKCFWPGTLVSGELVVLEGVHGEDSGVKGEEQGNCLSSEWFCCSCKGASDCEWSWLLSGESGNLGVRQALHRLLAGLFSRVQSLQFHCICESHMSEIMKLIQISS